MHDLDAEIRERIARRPSVFPGMARPSEMYDRYRGWSDRSAAALLAVLELHKPTYFGYADGDRYHGQPPDCAVCEDPGGAVSAWPCETVEAIAKELGIEVS